MTNVSTMRMKIEVTETCVFERVIDVPLTEAVDLALSPDDEELGLLMDGMAPLSTVWSGGTVSQAGSNEALSPDPEASDDHDEQRVFYVPEIDYPMNESEYIRVSKIIDLASGLFGDGGGGDLGENLEYERGQVELICDLAGLDRNDHFNEVRNAVYATARDKAARLA